MKFGKAILFNTQVRIDPDLETIKKEIKEDCKFDWGIIQNKKEIRKIKQRLNKIRRIKAKLVESFLKGNENKIVTFFLEFFIVRFIWLLKFELCEIRGYDKFGEQIWKFWLLKRGDFEI